MQSLFYNDVNYKFLVGCKYVKYLFFTCENLPWLKTEVRPLKNIQTNNETKKMSNIRWTKFLFIKVSRNQLPNKKIIDPC